METIYFSWAVPLDTAEAIFFAEVKQAQGKVNVTQMQDGETGAIGTYMQVSNRHTDCDTAALLIQEVLERNKVHTIFTGEYARVGTDHFDPGGFGGGVVRVTPCRVEYVTTADLRENVETVLWSSERP